MKYYTKEQIKELKELNVIQHFDTVLDSQFKRGTTTRQDNAVADIYDEATGIKISRNYSCKSCIYNLYRDAGNLYRESVKFWQNESLKKARMQKEINKKQKTNTNE